MRVLSQGEITQIGAAAASTRKCCFFEDLQAFRRQSRLLAECIMIIDSGNDDSLFAQTLFCCFGWAPVPLPTHIQNIMGLSKLCTGLNVCRQSSVMRRARLTPAMTKMMRTDASTVLCWSVPFSASAECLAAVVLQSGMSLPGSMPFSQA